MRSLQQYFAYFDQELEMLRRGLYEQTWLIKCLVAKTYEDIFHIVDVLRKNGDSRRPEIRQHLLSRFGSADQLGINQSINLAIRLWLMVNIQEPEFAGLRHEATPIQWNDKSTLRSFFQSLFPHSHWQVTAQSSRLGPHFTAAFMQRVCGLSIEWTTNLQDHLLLNRQRRAVRIFPYKCHSQALIDNYQNNTSNHRYFHEYLPCFGGLLY